MKWLILALLISSCSLKIQPQPNTYSLGNHYERIKVNQEERKFLNKHPQMTIKQRLIFELELTLTLLSLIQLSQSK